ncbi:hypothetical protein [Actinomadura flavalba]|uniref:hypothetical protein n=1 Tax=Actinomadura flavalba TaxID=1120938 RepID=UPI00036AC51D|nr:hypothetical protein [Actinomadura flavalba]
MTTIGDTEVTGDDAQVAFGNTVDGDLVQNQIRIMRGRPAMLLSDRQVTEWVDGYVPALNHDRVVATVREYGGALLVGPAEAENERTAVAVARAIVPGLRVRWFSPGRDDAEEIGVAGRSGYLVRASDEDPSRLRYCWEAVRDAGGLLLAIGGEDERVQFAHVLPSIVVEPPPAHDVYRRRLAPAGLDAARWRDWPRARDLLKAGSAADAERLIRLIAATGGDEYQVERAYLGWRDELRSWFREHDGKQDQVLLIAAATIAPADEMSVYEAALSLAERLRMSVAGGGLAWRPSAELEDVLGADRRADRILFRRQRFAASVIDHVWAAYPLLRPDLLMWLSELPAQPSVTLGAELRRKIARVFANLAAGHDRPELICATAREWAAGEEAARIGGVDLAFIVLSDTCLHPVVGGKVRRELYEWSQQQAAPQSLKLTIVRVCQVLAGTLPTVALTRLKHLSAGGDAVVHAEVAAVVRALAQDDPLLVFGVLMGWCDSAAGYRSPRAAERLASVALTAALDLVAAGLPAEADGAPRRRGPDDGEVEVRALARVLGRLADVDDEGVRRLVLAACLRLATVRRARVQALALEWLNGPDGSRASAGVWLFLMLAGVRAADGSASMLTDPGAVPVPASGRAWWDLGGAPTPEYADAVRLWLDTALLHPRLRAEIVEVFVRSTGHDPGRRARMLGLVRDWAGGDPRRRRVREDVEVHLLTPEWRRLLLVVLVRLRRTLAKEEPG